MPDAPQKTRGIFDRFLDAGFLQPCYFVIPAKDGIFALLQQASGIEHPASSFAYPEETVGYIIAAMLITGIIAFFILKKPRQEEDQPVESYVCDICGERHCDCRKEESG
jgi:hypothetical protein